MLDVWLLSRPRSNHPPEPRRCVVDSEGFETCTTPVAFAGATGGIHVTNHSCGWPPELRWDRILLSRDVRELSSVGMQGIIYQVPPPNSMRSLVAAREAAATGRSPCGWRCFYETARTAMVYQPRFINEAHRFLHEIKMRYAAEQPIADSAVGAAVVAEPRVLAVHWRRGDFLNRGGHHEMECAPCIHVPPTACIHTYLPTLFLH